MSSVLIYTNEFKLKTRADRRVDEMTRSTARKIVDPSGIFFEKLQTDF